MLRLAQLTCASVRRGEGERGRGEVDADPSQTLPSTPTVLTKADPSLLQNNELESKLQNLSLGRRARQ